MKDDGEVLRLDLLPVDLCPIGAGRHWRELGGGDAGESQKQQNQESNAHGIG
jgi:hypothetical protein